MGSGRGRSRRTQARLGKITDVILPDDLVPAEVELVGVDGNTGALMGHVAEGLKRAGNSREIIDRFRLDVMSGDYHHALRVCMAYSDGDALTDSEHEAELQRQRDEFAPKQTF